MKYLIVPVLMILYFVSCNSLNYGCNQQEAKRVKNFIKKHTGLDTLIRIDGYYYYEYYEGAELRITSFIFSGNGEFKRFGFFRTRESLQSTINLRPFNGNYTIEGDTIKTIWVSKFQMGMYDLFEEYFLIENDTTLRQIRYSGKMCPNGKTFDRTVNEIYKFYKYPVEMK
jgi:hypothetical protein